MAKQETSNTETDPIKIRVAEAQELLRALGFDRSRYNLRSALTLLALLGLRPADSWSDAQRPMLGTFAIMAWMEEHYGKKYAANSREPIRRETLHQFIQAGFAVLNPDDPGRPPNSDKTCYQLTQKAFDLVRSYQEPGFDERLEKYLEELPGLLTLYAAEREQTKVIVTLPDGTQVPISRGGQNRLIEKILDEFCPRFTPGGKVLYLGDAGSKTGVFQVEALAELGIILDSHGKLPDLIVHMPDRNWLVLIEAASTHGPVDAKRHQELKELFKASTAGLVFVSCLPSRDKLRAYLPRIAWETDVWCEDNPSHLIHFNGERFLGPYDAAPGSGGSS